MRQKFLSLARHIEQAVPRNSVSAIFIAEGIDLHNPLIYDALKLFAEIQQRLVDRAVGERGSRCGLHSQSCQTGKSTTPAKRPDQKFQTLY